MRDRVPASVAAPVAIDPSPLYPNRPMESLPEGEAIRLTRLSHGGGCGCKIAPALLANILAETGLKQCFANLLVGTESGDDAAVYQISPDQAIVATTDFFMPIVDDPYDFGRIAATNAISDVYAMGGRPVLALAIVGMPIDELPITVIRRILHGGEAVCHKAGIPLAGGHSIDAPEPIYGLVAIGLVHPEKIKRNNRARPGDILILGKPIGIGILSAALKKGSLSSEGYQQMLDTTTQLNTPGPDLAELDDVHALTDVTGFGLLGHLLEICRGSQLSAQLRFEALPILPAALEAARNGFATGASTRNWDSYGHAVRLPGDWPEWYQDLLTDPQTSGGLLTACSPSAVDQVMQVFRQHGFHGASIIGHLSEGPVNVSVS